MTPIEKTSDSVRAVDRALDILMAFTAADFELSAAELLRRVDLSRPTLYRLLHTLEQNGFIISVGEPQRFRLGPSVAHLAHVWTASLDIGTLAQPMMRRLWEQTHETVALFVPQAEMRLCVAELPSPQALSFKRGVGYQERLVAGASGRVMLAHMSIDADTLARYAAGTGTDVDRCLTELAQIRTRGYAISRNELIEGAVAVAAPFFNGAGLVAGSLAVFGPSARLNEQRAESLGALLQQEAITLSKTLGQR